MKPILLSTAYLPPISWMAVAMQTEHMGIELQETFPKQTYRNRCTIATSSGKLNLTVPVKRINGNHTRTCDIRIDNSNNWQLLHWRSIITAYNKSPFFLYYRDQFESLFFKKQEHLVDLNRELLNELFKALQIKSLEIFYTNEYVVKSDVYDLRNSFHPKSLTHHPVKIEFPRYMQSFEENHGFIPDLSIFDLLFNMGPDAFQYLINLKLSFEE